MVFSRISKKTGSPQLLKDHLYAVSVHLKEHLHPLGLGSLGELLGLVHDFGKIAPQWQEYLLSGTGSVNHSSGGVYFLWRATAEFPSSLENPLLPMFEMTIQGHHGGLRDSLSPEGIPNVIEKLVYSSEEVAQMDQWFYEEIASRERFKSLWEASSLEWEECWSRIKKNTYIPMFQGATNQCRKMQLALLVRFIFSALIDADRFDAAFCDGDFRETLDFSWELFQTQLERMDFSKDGLNKYRAQIAHEAKSFQAKERGIYQFPAPTGSGKTLSSLGFALETAKTHQKSRILFIAPFLSILEQNANEVRKALQIENDSPLLVEHHTNFEEKSTNIETVSTRELATERWDSPLIFTSLVQFLNSGFRSDSARRLQGLANSVIIIDEVQTVPRHCLYFFHSFLHFLRDYCNCVILITTATPPCLPEKFFQLDYDIPKSIVNITPEIRAAFSRTFFKVLEGKWEDDQIGNLVLEKQVEFQSVLLIVNTKATAYSIYSVIKKQTEVPVIYLSTELCPAHRNQKVNEMKQLLEEQNPVICISTQLIEAGVDVSFPVVIRSMAGLDSMIQASGRCNRHGNMEMSPVYVVRATSERLDVLPDIERGKSISNTLIEVSPALPLDDIETVNVYFKHFFHGQEPKLNNALFSQFGENKKGRVAYRQETGNSYSKLLGQAFRTVGRKFTPIEDNTIGIVVPYGEGTGLLQNLKNDDGEERKLLRKLQRFTVNVYPYKLASLSKEGVIYYDESLELWCMKPNCYDDVTGIRNIPNNIPNID